MTGYDEGEAKTKIEQFAVGKRVVEVTARGDQFAIHAREEPAGDELCALLPARALADVVPTTAALIALTMAQPTNTAFRISNDETLSIELSSGQVLTVPPDPDFEAWEIRNGRGDVAVCLPGGGFADFTRSDADDCWGQA